MQTARLPEATAVARLAALRRRVPWTQRELAAAAGVSVGTVRGLEQGRRRAPHPRVIRAVAAALDVPPAAVAEFRGGLGLSSADAAWADERVREESAGVATRRCLARM